MFLITSGGIGLNLPSGLVTGLFTLCPCDGARVYVIELMPHALAKPLWLYPGMSTDRGAPLEQRGGATAKVTEFCRNRSWDRWEVPCRCSPRPPGQVTGQEGCHLAAHAV